MEDTARPGRALADAIAAEISRRHHTQDEAAIILGTTQQTVGKWINGRTRPNEEHLAPLATYLGMTEDKVRELRGSMRSDPRERVQLRRRVEELEQAMGEILERVRRIDERLPRD